MQEKLQALNELQKVDLEIAALRKSADVHPKQMGDLDKELAVAKSALEAERARLLDLERQKRTLEQNIVDEKDKVKKWETRLSEQRSTREYAALAREIDIAKKANQTMAEELIELGRTYGVARETLKAKELEFAAKRGEIEGKLGELRKKTAESDGQVKELDDKRQQTSTKVDSTMLRRYEAVRKKRMPAMVSVKAGTCQGCNMLVPPQLYNDLCASRSTDICPSCNRIIYAAEALERPAK